MKSTDSANVILSAQLKNALRQVTLNLMYKIYFKLIVSDCCPYKIAHELLESMDTTADPCQDFYQFACGGWLKKYSIPESSTRWGQFDILRQHVSDQLRGKFG